jgi:hypothetical protein
MWKYIYRYTRVIDAAGNVKPGIVPFTLAHNPEVLRCMKNYPVL